MNNKQKILLAITSDRGFYTCFKENFEFLGFQVYLLRDIPFSYKNNLDRVVNFIYKTLLNNKNYKNKLYYKSKKTIDYEAALFNSITDKVDYSLTIRPDIFSLTTLKNIISKSTKAYAYQWDGLKRHPKVINIIHLFKIFYIFEKTDKKYGDNTKLVTNFYFDCYDNIFNISDPEFDIYYIGSDDSRIEELISLCSNLHNLGLKLNIVIPCSKRRRKILNKYPFFNLPEKPFSYKENLMHVANAKAILEISHTNIHSGLSFRAFEALGHNKKLITNNSTIKQYDFYNNNNIYILTNENDIVSFLNTPIKVVDHNIKIKYSFTNWVKNIFELDHIN